METLKLLKNTSEKFIKYILNTRNNNEIQNNGKLNFIIQEMELTWELISKMIILDEKSKKILNNIQNLLIEWKKKLTPIIGPIFSDNIPSLKKKMRRGHFVNRSILKKKTRFDQCSFFSKSIYKLFLDFCCVSLTCY